MVLLRQPEIFRQQRSLSRGVVGEASKVEVGQRAARKKVPSEHLTNGLEIKSETSNTRLGSEEKCEEVCEHQRNEITPPR